MPNHEASIHLTRPEAAIAALTMRRQAGPNVIDAPFCEQLLDACQTLARDESLHAVLLRADGPTFCVGADISQMLARIDDLPAYLSDLIDRAHAAVLALVALPVPVIACVQGTAAGGGFSLALACDSMIVSHAAQFVVAYPQLGVSPDTGFTHSLSSRVGPHRAMQICFSQTPLDGAEAHRLGVADELADNGALDVAGLSAARHLASTPRTAVVGTKALLAGDDMTALAARMQREKEWFLRCAETEALRDRILSFSQRRRLGQYESPTFKEREHGRPLV